MSRALRLSLLCMAVALLLPAAPVTPAQAKTAPCIADYPHGAQCRAWIGKVRYVDDGDTLDADVPGDGLGGLLRVRIIGVQAMEQTSYRASRRAGDCHALDATNRLEQLVRRSKRKIRVTSLYPESRSRGRRLRSVAVRIKGRWRDVGRILVSEGHALWLPGLSEDASNERYSLLTQKAAAAKRGLFNSTYCGIGPNEGQPIGLWAQWDADGDDGQDVNGEWVKVRNYDPVNPLPLGGWYLRDTGLRRFTFPAGASVPPNSSVTVYAGQGESFGNEYFWNLTRPVFENTTRDDRGMGDGAYLFDPQGDIRAWQIYPCRINCTNPAQGQISLGTQPRKDEYISVTNHGGTVIDLEPYVLKTSPYSYSFPQGATLAPGQTIRVHTQGDAEEDTVEDRYWGMTGQILNNGGDKVTFGTYSDVIVACTAYGSKSC